LLIIVPNCPKIQYGVGPGSSGVERLANHTMDTPKIPVDRGPDP